MNDETSPDSNILSRLFAPVDNASLTFFRIGWGWILVIWAWDYLTSGRVGELYVSPTFHFTFLYFDWVQPWPGSGMYLHFCALLLLAFAIMVGFFYRTASFLFAIGFTYIFLLDQTNYQNHYYLVMLISWVNVFLPLNQNLSWDSRRNPSMASETVAAWVLWVVRFHIGVPYFFGGLAKFVPDWMLGEPMGTYLKTKANFPLVGSFFGSDYAGLMFSWGGIFLDLAAVPLLMYRKTRLIAYLAIVTFHLTNSVLFSIQIFPWFMILATTIFFEPDWPRRLLGLARIELPKAMEVRWGGLSNVAKLAIAFGCCYIGFHALWPFRYRTFQGDPSWTEQGQFFSWRMMLRGKTGVVQYFVTDPESKKTVMPDLGNYLNQEQIAKFPKNPEWILHLAHRMAVDFEASKGYAPEVHALVMLSLNGRKPSLLIDPNVDLVPIPRGQRVRPWVLPNDEPLRKDPWKGSIEMPRLQFLETAPLVQPPSGNEM